MQCPFCKGTIPANVELFQHMLQCQREEARLWDARFTAFLTQEAARRAAQGGAPDA